jgi:hypothetical protein
MLSYSKSALYLLLASPLLAALIAVGCSDGTEGGGASVSTQSGSGANGGAGGAGGGVGGNVTTSVGGSDGGGWGPGDGGFVITPCTNQVYACGDTIDNDGDGLVDWQDPECLGPCDNTENGLDVGIPGGSGPACDVECFWDSNSGAGNDECYWNHQCDPLSVAPDYYPEWWQPGKCAHDPNANTPGTAMGCDELLVQQSAQCESFCAPLAPNGCDCFGCCVLYKEGVQYGPLWLGTEDGKGNFTCTLADIGDPKKCAPCTQVKGACFNECGKCELCIGKDTLPPECNPPPPDAGTDSGVPPPPPQCEAGVQPCGLEGQELCAAGYYCLTGCCIAIPK